MMIAQSCLKVNKRYYRPNVGIVIVNSYHQVFWAKRFGQNAWQFPQGGVDDSERLEEAMHRELFEETGLLPKAVEVLARTKSWLYYDLPDSYKSDAFSRAYHGQKQIWFLLKLLATDDHIAINQGACPEFDDWCWCDYWLPIEQIIDFKKPIYTKVLQDFAAVIDVIPYDLWQKQRSTPIAG